MRQASHAWLSLTHTASLLASASYPLA